MTIARGAFLRWASALTAGLAILVLTGFAGAQSIPRNILAPIIRPPAPEPKPETPTPEKPSFSCPTGYGLPSPSERLGTMKGCIPVDQTATVCAGRKDVYSCGRNAAECCTLKQDNPCYAGSYPCDFGPNTGAGRRACCVR
jgi:hypothetical protein